jgi:REP element-mobilizing transposase RayT
MKYKVFHDKEHLYFITSTISGHKMIFDRGEYALIIIKCLDYLRRKGFIKLYSFVVMPNHVHQFIKLRKNYTINQVIDKFHSFTAHQILKQLRLATNRNLLNYFQKFAFSRKSDRKHYFWQDTLVKNIFSHEALEKVIEYIHSNPCNKNWSFVKDRADYKYSSACFYDKGKMPIIEIDDVEELFK